MKTIQEAISDVKKFDFKNATQEEIESILPTFGMNDEQLFEMPSEMSEYFGWGVKFWQYPNQFSKLICYLREKEINSYLEIGCRWGGTFIILNEVLRKYNPHLDAYALDFIPASDILHSYQNDFKGNPFVYLQMDSNGSYFFYHMGGFLTVPNVQMDCVFIDGNHTYWGIKEDYHRALTMGAKYIIFHDIVNQSCNPCRKAWKNIKKNHKNIVEFNDQYDSINGTYLGIAVVEVSKEDKCFPHFQEYYPDLFGE